MNEERNLSYLKLEEWEIIKTEVGWKKKEIHGNDSIHDSNIHVQWTLVIMSSLGVEPEKFTCHHGRA